MLIEKETWFDVWIFIWEGILEEAPCAAIAFNNESVAIPQCGNGTGGEDFVRQPASECVGNQMKRFHK